MQNPVLTAILSRRSVRRFTGQAVSRQEVAAMLEAARWAPSGLNNQPWRFLVLWQGDARLEPLADCTRYGPVVRNAAACVCVFLERAAMYNPMKDHQGAGAAIQNLLLAAHAQGLGAVWLGEIVNQSAQAMAALGLDAEALELQAVVAVGRPHHPGASSRKELAELMLEPL